VFVSIIVLNTQAKSLELILLVPLIINIDASILLFFLSHQKETSQPFFDAIKKQHAPSQEAVWLVYAGPLFAANRIIHSSLLASILLWCSMVLAGRGLGGAHHRSIRAVEDQPNYSFYSPRNQSID